MTHKQLNPIDKRKSYFYCFAFLRSQSAKKQNRESESSMLPQARRFKR